MEREAIKCRHVLTGLSKLGGRDYCRIKKGDIDTTRTKLEKKFIDTYVSKVYCKVKTKEDEDRKNLDISSSG